MTGVSENDGDLLEILKAFPNPWPIRRSSRMIFRMYHHGSPETADHISGRHSETIRRNWFPHLVLSARLKPQECSSSPTPTACRFFGEKLVLAKPRHALPEDNTRSSVPSTWGIQIQRYSFHCDRGTCVRALVFELSISWTLEVLEGYNQNSRASRSNTTEHHVHPPASFVDTERSFEIIPEPETKKMSPKCSNEVWEDRSG